MSSVLIRLMEAGGYIGVSSSTLGNYTNPKSKYYIPDFPKKVRIGARCVGFLKEELDAWVARRAADSLVAGGEK